MAGILFVCKAGSWTRSDNAICMSVALSLRNARFIINPQSVCGHTVSPIQSFLPAISAYMSSTSVNNQAISVPYRS